MTVRIAYRLRCPRCSDSDIAAVAGSPEAFACLDCGQTFHQGASWWPTKVQRYEQIPVCDALLSVEDGCRERQVSLEELEMC